ncbi:CPBP family intramembrane glutamic endopeptidase [Parafrankia discariae]|uniref:CPBP family intramembrane glutamic endopeptidase n=1 Tax=Parafrankia discariae TaxID=365528 RepID=UPI00037126B1|nr:type II CAAX endopeptidase family protein [Parafrankia discariae]
MTRASIGSGRAGDSDGPAGTAATGAASAGASAGAGAAGAEATEATGGTGATGGEPLSRRSLRTEILLVLGVSFGASGLFALIRYLGVLTAQQSVRSQVARLNSSAAPGRPWLDLALQAASLATALVPALLVVHLLGRHGGGPAAIGLDRRRSRSDAARGAALAAVVGGTGLAFYLVAWHSGANLTVAPSNLPDVWWRIPVLVASAAQNGLAEEVVVAGYLLVRLREMGWGENRALAASALLRGSYHLYQGLGGFAGNVAMGLLFGRIFQRTGRVLPLVIAHTLIDTVAFVGYVTLAGRVSWIPVPR